MKKAAEQSGYEKGMLEGRKKAETECKTEYEKMSRNTLQDVKEVIENVEQMKEDLLKRYRNQLKDVAIAIAEKVIQVSLKSSEEVIERMVISATERLKTREWAKVYMIFANLSSRMAESIKSDLEITTNVRKKDVEDAQQRIVGIIRKLEEQGEIVIMKGGRDDIIA